MTVPEPTPKQREWLQCVFERFVAMADWPKESVLQVELDRKDVDLNVIEVARELPRQLGYIYEGQDPQARVTVRGISSCAGSDRLLVQFVKAVELLAAKYLAQERITKAELRAAIGGDDVDVRRVFLVLEREGHFLSSGDGPDGEWTREVSRQAREFRKVRSLSDYLAKLDELESRKTPYVLALERAVDATARLMDRGSRGADPRQEAPEDEPRETEYDAFIAHAAADKNEVVRPLAEELQRRGYRIWYDEWTLKIGDSLGRTIDAGLRASRYGVVVLSPSFFTRTWTKKELDALEAREARGTKVILPVWHRLRAEDVTKHSPMLAARLAARTELGIDKVADAISEVLGPLDSLPVRPPTGSESSEIDLRIAEPANQASEGWLEWLHLEAFNLGSRRADDCRMKASVGPHEVQLMWSGAQESITLRRDFPVTIPLVIRAREFHADAPIYGVRLDAYQCFVTDRTFLQNGMAVRRLDPGRHEVEVTLHHGDSGRATRAFVLEVPLPNAGPLHLTAVR